MLDRARSPNACEISIARFDQSNRENAISADGIGVSVDACMLCPGESRGVCVIVDSAWVGESSCAGASVGAVICSPIAMSLHAVQTRMWHEMHSWAKLKVIVSVFRMEECGLMDLVVFELR